MIAKVNFYRIFILAISKSKIKLNSNINFQIVFVLLGVSTLATAFGVRGRPGKSNTQHHVLEEVIREPQSYQQAVKVVEETPIRVSYQKETVREPVREPVRSYGSYSSAGAPGRSSSSYSKMEEEEELRLIEEQNRSAQYEFASAVDDGIMDQSHIRQEKREGNKVSDLPQNIISIL